MTFNLTVKNNVTAQRFEVQVGDHLAVIQYQRQGNRITLFTQRSRMPWKGRVWAAGWRISPLKWNFKIHA